MLILISLTRLLFSSLITSPNIVKVGLAEVNKNDSSNGKNTIAFKNPKYDFL